MIEIVDYRSTWPDEFQQIARTIRSALGEAAMRIDHIGSTSIPGLCAKDVIDLQISVERLDGRVSHALRAIGYTQVDDIVRDHRPPDDDGPAENWQKLYFRPPSGQRRTNTHVRALGRPNQRYALLFRDYLRVHSATAAAYGELKRRLAVSLANPDDYPDVKDPAVDLIFLPAKLWAIETGWDLGPTDA